MLSSEKRGVKISNNVRTGKTDGTWWVSQRERLIRSKSNCSGPRMGVGRYVQMLRRNVGGGEGECAVDTVECCNKQHTCIRE